MKTPSNTTILAAHLAARGALPHHAAAVAEALAAIARSAKTAAVAACNHQRGYDALPSSVARNLKRATALLARYQGISSDGAHMAPETIKAMRGVSVTIGGDPRGYCLRVLGLPGNSMGGDDSGFGL